MKKVHQFIISTVAMHLFVWQFPSPVLSADVAEVKVEVLLDSKVLRFPEPIYGFVRMTNVTNDTAFMPSNFSGRLSFNIGGRKSEIGFDPNYPLLLRLKPANYSIIVPFRHLITDKAQVDALLHVHLPVSISLSIGAIPKRRPLPKLRDPNTVTYHEAGGYDWVVSKPVTLHYNLDKLVFRDGLDPDLAKKTLDSRQWPDANPFLIPVPYKGPDFYEFGRELAELQGLDEGFMSKIPIVWLFREQANRIQAVVRCDTATWRLLELWRILRGPYPPETAAEDWIKIGEDIINVLRCAGRAEAFYLSQRVIGLPENKYVEIEGVRISCQNYVLQRMYKEIPFLRSMIEPFGLVENIREDTVHPLFQGVPLADRKEWKPEYNDVNQPSPRETTMKLWIDGGNQGPNPCPCWNDADDVELNKPFSNELLQK